MRERGWEKRWGVSENLKPALKISEQNADLESFAESTLERQNEVKLAINAEEVKVLEAKGYRVITDSELYAGGEI